MTELPIFQMVLEPLEDGSYGLIFSDELDDEFDGFIQPVFVLPLKYNGQYWWKNKFYMPGEIDGEYVEFKVEPRGEIFYLNNDSFKQSIRFGIEDIFKYKGYEIFDKRFLGAISRLKYVGGRKDFISPFLDFIIISPLDLLLMDALFREQKVCFVGLTPVFGEKRSYDG